jgi:hypothetical protein
MSEDSTQLVGKLLNEYAVNPAKIFFQNSEFPNLAVWGYLQRVFHCSGCTFVQIKDSDCLHKLDWSCYKPSIDRYQPTLILLPRLSCKSSLVIAKKVVTEIQINTIQP